MSDAAATASISSMRTCGDVANALLMERSPSAERSAPNTNPNETTMTKEEKRQYAKEYRAEGFGAIADRAYYMRHRDEICAKAREKYHATRDSYRKKVTL